MSHAAILTGQDFTKDAGYIAIQHPRIAFVTQFQTRSILFETMKYIWIFKVFWEHEYLIVDDKLHKITVNAGRKQPGMTALHLRRKLHLIQET
jgi:hypothetical protein